MLGRDDGMGGLSGLCLARARRRWLAQASNRGFLGDWLERLGWLERALYGRLPANSPDISNLPQRLLKYLGRLAALDQMPVIQDDGRDGIDAQLGVKAFTQSDCCRVLARGQKFTGAVRA